MSAQSQRGTAATVIIGFAESLSAPEVAWSLVDHGYSVVAFTRKGKRSALSHSRFVRLFEITPPEQDLTQAIEDLQLGVGRMAAGSGPLVMMPLDDASVWLCGRAKFSDAVTVAGPRGDGVEIALNKQKQFELAKTSGFNLPSARYVARREDVRLEEVKFPVVFKPAEAARNDGGHLSKGQGWICSDRLELEAALTAWACRTPMLLQEFVPGLGEGIFGLATGRGVVAWSGHRRLRMMNPHGSGASACTVAPEADAATKAAAERFLAGCGWRGLFMIEMLRDKSGKLWFIEFNGRCWGSMALARRAGFEYPAWAVRTALTPDASLQIPGARNGSPVCRHLGREMLYLAFVLRGSKSKALTEWPSFWSALTQVVRIGRNDRWYNWRKDDKKVFFSDFYGTIRDQLFRSKA
jgi:predicted ATP-grasp superfamily ATP-dependent carboligase